MKSMNTKRLFILLPTFLFCYSLLAQTYLGFKGGINRSKSTYAFNINAATISDRADLYGVYFGIPLEIEIDDLVNFMPELVIASEGSVISVQTDEGHKTYNNALIYAKIPLIAKLKLLRNKNYEFGILGGIVPAYAIDLTSYFFTLSDVRNTTNVPLTFEEAGIKRFDMGLSVGLNTEKIIAKGWKIVIDLRYNLGVLDVEKYAALTTTTESFSLTVGILMPVFKEKEKKKELNF
jgi:hypothetical protein